MSTTTSHDHLTEHARLDPQRLLRRVDRGASLLAERLAGARAEHDLTWRSLLSAQEEVGRMTRNGSAPGIDDFWTTTAEPMAQPLLDTCLEAIDECFDMVAAGVQRTDFGPGEHDVAIAERASEIWSTVTFDPTGLNELGQKWQRRLHRHATPKAILASAMRPASEFHLQREMTEMAMLDQPPWRHGDRILTAFELAHSDIRSAIRQTQVDLSALFA